MKGENREMDPIEPSLLQSGRSWFARRSLLFRLLGVGFFCLILLVPLGMVRSTMHERQWRYDQAVDSIAKTWGPAQRLLGPVLAIPYTYSVEVTERSVLNGRESVELVMKTVSGHAYFLPETLEVNGRLEPSERKRGIYTTHVYSASTSMNGRFAKPDFSFLEFPDLEPQWDHARVCFAVSDLRGARGSVPLLWNGVGVPTEPGALIPGFANGMHAPVELDPESEGSGFSLELVLNGSGQFSVVPTARETTVHLNSPWADPSFDGAFLPVNREVSPEGFGAEWQVSYLGRGFPQRWSDRGGAGGITEANAQSSAFGVTLLDTVTPYRTVERSIKYGVLFIVLAFATFFLFETTCAVRLNALNYLLVGAALCLFYLGLLALSEFLVFVLAYGIAGTVSVALIGLYSRSILKSGRRAVIVSAMLGGVYAYLYFVVQLEDFALLAGTGALFAMLAALMFFTRQFNGTGPAPAKAEAPGN